MKAHNRPTLVELLRGPLGNRNKESQKKLTKKSCPSARQEPLKTYYFGWVSITTLSMIQLLPESLWIIPLLYGGRRCLLASNGPTFTQTRSLFATSKEIDKHVNKLIGMASKTLRKSQNKENGGSKTRANASEEMDLRDEILDLKKEMAALRKEKDKLVIQVRKCEAESKRKDQQIEQLMDPSQNSEIRRLLSIKGAALLLNLKEQNKTLVQMVMEKDLQIKRLLGEVKTAKLYCRTSKTEPYRIEIARLRNMLLQSQEALREAAAAPQVSHNVQFGLPNSSSSSDQATPRELEELQFTIQSLETHMKYSKELILKKNQEIILLNQQLQDAIHGHHSNQREKQWKADHSWIQSETSNWATSSEGMQQVQYTGSKEPDRRRSMSYLSINKVNESGDILKRTFSEKELIKLETEALWKTLKRRDGDDVEGRAYKGSLGDSLTDVMNGKGSSNDEKKKSKDKWRAPVKKLRNPPKRKKVLYLSTKTKIRKGNKILTDKVAERIEENSMKNSDEVDSSTRSKSPLQSEEESSLTVPKNLEGITVPRDTTKADDHKDLKYPDGRIIPTNWKVNDEEVWGIINKDIQRKPSSPGEPEAVTQSSSKPPGQIQRKYSLEITTPPVAPKPRRLSLAPSVEKSPKTAPVPMRRTKIGELSKEDFEEDILVQEELPQKISPDLQHQKIHRPSIDSSMFDSESGSLLKFEPKLVEVEVEINAFPSSSSVEESPRVSEVEEVKAKKEGGDNFFDDDDDDDDDDVITI